MTDSTEINSTVPITLTIDLQQLLNATVGTIPEYTGDPDADEWQPDPVSGAIIDAAARQLAREVSRDERSSYRTYYRDAIDKALGELIAAELDKPFKPVDQYGEVKTSAEPTTLRDAIGKQAAEVIAKGMNPGSTWNGRRENVGSLTKYIDTEIDRQIKGELQAAVAEAKAAVVDKVKANAAQVITDTIARAAVR